VIVSSKPSTQMVHPKTNLCDSFLKVVTCTLEGGVMTGKISMALE